MTLPKPDKSTTSLKIEVNLHKDLTLLKIKLNAESLNDVIQVLYNEFEGVKTKK